MFTLIAAHMGCLSSRSFTVTPSMCAAGWADAPHPHSDSLTFRGDCAISQSILLRRTKLIVR